METDTGKRTHIVRDMALNSMVKPHGLCGAWQAKIGTVRTVPEEDEPSRHNIKQFKTRPALCARCADLFARGAH